MKRIIALFLLVVASAHASMAQAPPPSGGSTVGAPVDDNIWFLAIAVMIYGTYTIYQNRKQLALKKA